MTKPIAKQKTVGKDFSVLKERKRIDMTAVSIFKIVDRLEAERTFEPKAGTEMHRAWKLGKLTIRQQRAWRSFREEFDRARGKSGSVGSSYGDFTDGNGDGLRIPVAFSNDEQRNIEWLFGTYLNRDEALLLYDLLQDDLASRGNFNIELVGFLKSNYKKEETARANGIGHIQALMTRLACRYGH